MNITIFPSERELVYGRRYLLFQIVFLAYAVSLVASLAGLKLNDLLLNLCCFGVNFVVCILMFRDFLQKSIRQGLRDWKKTICTAVVGFAVYELAMKLLGLLYGAIDPAFSNRNDAAIEAMGQQNYLLMAFCTVLVVPVYEECLHRAVVFGGLCRRNRPLAYLFSTALFSLVHISGYLGAMPPQTFLMSFVQYLPAGAVLAAAFSYSGSILTPIVIHAAVNALGMLLLR